MQPHKIRITITILTILLLAAATYITYDFYQEKKQEKELNIFQQGAQYGYEQAVIQLMQEATTCQPVSLFAENQTLNMIAVECLQQPSQQFQTQDLSDITEKNNSD